MNQDAPYGDMEAYRMVSYPTVVTGPQTAESERAVIWADIDVDAMNRRVRAAQSRMRELTEHLSRATRECGTTIGEGNATFERVALDQWDGRDPMHHTPTDVPDPIADIINRIDEVLQ